MLTFVEFTEAAELKTLWPIVSQLRPWITEKQFISRTASAAAEGFHLHAAQDDGLPVGVIGWRIVHDLANGRSLYIDDLVVDEKRRGQRIGRAMIEFASKLAREHGCNAIRLTSAVHRHDAHRFYEGLGIGRTGYSFKQSLD